MAGSSPRAAGQRPFKSCATINWVKFFEYAESSIYGNPKIIVNKVEGKGGGD